MSAAAQGTRRARPAVRTAIVAGTVLVALALPWIVGQGYYLQIFTIAALNLILALGLNIVLGLSGQLALAHAGFFGVGAYTSALLVMKLGLSFWLALPLSALFAGLIGGLVGSCSLRLRGHYLAIVTAGFGIIIYQVFLNWTSVTRGAAALIGIPPPDSIPLFGIATLTFNTRLSMYFLILAATFLAVFLFWRIKYSRVGDAFLAIREDEIAAEVNGVNTFAYKLLAFVLSAVYAGVAGSLFAHYTRIIAPEMFHLFEIVNGLLMVVAGGLGSIWGVAVTSVFFTAAPELMRELSEFRMIAYGLLLVVVIVFLPNGLAGGLGQLRTGPLRRLFARRADADA